MTLVRLPTRTTSHWIAAESGLQATLPVADHPLLDEHAARAARFHREFGIPTRVWANRIAAIAVIAERRADTAPTIQRRTAYIEVAAAARELLLLAEEVHGVVPDDEALALLSSNGDRSAVLI